MGIDASSFAIARLQAVTGGFIAENPFRSLIKRHLGFLRRALPLSTLYPAQTWPSKFKMATSLRIPVFFDHPTACVQASFATIWTPRTFLYLLRSDSCKSWNLLGWMLNSQWFKCNVLLPKGITLSSKRFKSWQEQVRYKPSEISVGWNCNSCRGTYHLHTYCSLLMTNTRVSQLKIMYSLQNRLFGVFWTNWGVSEATASASPAPRKECFAPPSPPLASRALGARRFRLCSPKLRKKMPVLQAR